MSIAIPLILSPTTDDSFRTSSLSQLVSGTTAAETTNVAYTYAYVEDAVGGIPVYTTELETIAISMTSPNTSNTGTIPLPWSFNSALAGADPAPGWTLHVRFYALDEVALGQSDPAEVAISFITTIDLPISAPVPTGITVDRANTYLRPTTAEVSLDGYDGDFLGYNFYVSTTSGGGTAGYSLLNDEYVVVPSSVKTYKTSVGSSEQKSGNVVVSAGTSVELDMDQYSYDFDASALSRMVAAGTLDGTDLDGSTTYYFVATTMMYDTTLGMVVESTYSPEVYARFVTFSAVYNELPVRSRDQIAVTLMQRLYGRNSQVHLMPSSVYKDILDPISEEFSDYYVIQDFLAKTESIKGLMQFDDEDGDGVSDSVETSVNKTRLRLALKLTNADQVQDLIDTYFEKKAANFNITRLSPGYAKGTVLYYASSIPEEGLSIVDGAILSTGPGYGNSNAPVKFTVTGSKFIPYSKKEIYYNSVEDRYEIEAVIKASYFGSLANVSAGAINFSVSGADPRFSVENTSPTSGGTDTESNLSLGNRTQLAIAGVDSGTEGGYLLTALSVPGVRSARVESGGDPLMVRDIDSTTGEHIGGKVDVYVQSESLGEKQDIIAYSYDGPLGEGSEEIFFVEDAINFRVRTENSNVTSATPIFEVIRIYNATRAANYDISGYVVVGDGDTVLLTQNSTNLRIGMATMDVIEVDYRYRGSNSYILDNQPVEEIVSITGDVDGLLSVENYDLYKLEDPLLNGESTIAQDGISLNYFNGVPTDSTINVSAEAHVFLTSTSIKLAKKGIDIDTIVVSSDDTGIDVYEKDLDYTIGKGGQAGYSYLYLQPYSKIRAGSTVYVGYTHSQNFKVVYTVNEALLNVQSSLDETKHAAADVVAKKAVHNYVDIVLQVIRMKGFSAATVEDKIQTLIGNYVSNLHVGQPLMMDNVIALVKSVDGVKTLVLPITRMRKQDDSFIPRDYVGYADFKVYTQNASKGVTSYITVNSVLNYGTLTNGGSSTRFRSIYEGGTSLVLSDTPLEVSSAQGRGYILADGKLLVSTTDGAPPQGKEYRASYYTYVSPEEDFSGDITVDQVETLMVNSSSISVDASAEDS